MPGRARALPADVGRRLNYRYLNSAATTNETCEKEISITGFRNQGRFDRLHVAVFSQVPPKNV